MSGLGPNHVYPPRGVGGRARSRPPLYRQYHRPSRGRLVRRGPAAGLPPGDRDGCATLAALHHHGGGAFGGRTPGARERLQAAAQLLTDLLAQDVEETPGADGTPQVSLREGTTPGRKSSATDAEQRHGRKSKSRRFDGHKASIATAVGSKIVVGAEVLAGDAPDDSELLAQVSAVEAATGLSVATTLGDCAYGSGARRAEFAEAERELVAKVGQETPNPGRFTKSQFVVVWGTDAATSVQCSAGQSTTHFTHEQSGARCSSSVGAATGVPCANNAPAPRGVFLVTKEPAPCPPNWR